MRLINPLMPPADLPRPRLVSKTHSPKARHVTILVCPYCNEPVNSKVMRQHVCTEHADRLTDWNESQKRQKGLIDCPYCTAAVRADRLKIHIGKVHSEIE